MLTVSTGEVSSLKHEVRDDTVELGALVAHALLARAQRAEVLRRLGHHISVQLELNATSLAGDVQVKED